MKIVNSALLITLGVALTFAQPTDTATKVAKKAVKTAPKATARATKAGWSRVKNSKPTSTLPK